MATAATQQFSEPTGASKAFSLHLNGNNYDYVMNYAKTHNVTRNRAINLIIEDHANPPKVRRVKSNGS